MKPVSDFSVFLVDDDPFFLSVCEQYLHNTGFTNVRQFQSGTEFLKNMQLQPDLIFLDYNMDSLNGIETLKKIKRFNPDSLVVFISGQENIDIAVNALKYGAFDYLVKKNINEEKIKSLLEKGIALKKMVAAKNKKSIVRRLLPFIGIVMVCLFVYRFFVK